MKWAHFLRKSRRFIRSRQLKFRRSPMQWLISFFVGMALLLPSCLEEIELGIPKELKSAVVIKGKLVKGKPSSIEVQIWARVKELVERTNSIFEPPAGQLEGNFKNVDNPGDEVFGFFYAVEEDTARVYISPEWVGSPKPFCPPAYFLCPSNVCCDCAVVAGSTLITPDFWDP